MPILEQLHTRVSAQIMEDLGIDIVLDGGQQLLAIYRISTDDPQEAPGPLSSSQHHQFRVRTDAVATGILRHGLRFRVPSHHNETYTIIHVRPMSGGWTILRASRVTP